FFLQAEDGIRDGHVTGVQTCALPICTAGTTSKPNRLQQVPRSAPARTNLSSWASRAASAAASRLSAERIRASSVAADCCRISARSEERRVGKEGRDRWAPDEGWKRI